jgi:PAS domain S-box-containing protein
MAAERDGRDEEVETESDDGDVISVVYIDDYEELCELTAVGLEEASDRLSVTKVTDPTVATESLLDYDCIVSDYEMPERDGLELLRQVRVLDDDIPFILYTGEGSEDVASDAIELDVTDYLTKSGGSERFTRLAHRVESVVDARRATEAAQQTREQAADAIERERARFRALIEHSPAATGVLDTSGTFEYVSPSIERITGHAPRDLVGESAFDYVHEEDRERLVTEFQRCLENPSYRPTVEYQFEHENGDWRYLETTGVNRLDDPAVEGFIVNTRDITQRKRTEKRLRRERDLTERVLEVTPTPVLVFDSDGVIRRANDRAAEVFDTRKSDIVGLSPSAENIEFRDSDGETIGDGEYLWELVTNAKRAIRDVDCEVSFSTGDYRLTVSAAPLQRSTKPLIVVSVDDIEPIDTIGDNNT